MVNVAAVAVCNVAAVAVFNIAAVALIKVAKMNDNLPYNAVGFIKEILKLCS